MRIIIEDEEVVERVRRRAGDKSATETVSRLIREADETSTRRGLDETSTSKMKASAQPAKRKGAK